MFVLTKPPIEGDEIGGMDERMIGKEDEKEKAGTSGIKRKLLDTNVEEDDVEIRDEMKIQGKDLKTYVMMPI